MQQPVLSIPAGTTESLIHRWHIYVCPDRPPYTAHLQNAEFVCFRHEIRGINGATDKIYKILQIKKFDLSQNTLAEVIQQLDLAGFISDLDLRTYFMQYLKDPVLKQNLRQGPHLLVALDKGGVERLNNLPRPERNNSFWPTYTREELRNNTFLPSRN